MNSLTVSFMKCDMSSMFSGFKGKNSSFITGVVLASLGVVAGIFAARQLSQSSMQDKNILQVSQKEEHKVDDAWTAKMAPLGTKPTPWEEVLKMLDEEEGGMDLSGDGLTIMPVKKVEAIEEEREMIMKEVLTPMMDQIEDSSKEATVTTQTVSPTTKEKKVCEDKTDGFETTGKVGDEVAKAIQSLKDSVKASRHKSFKS